MLLAEEGEETEVVNGKKNMENESEKLEPDREWELGNREIEHSQNVMKDLEKRRVTLEGKLLELYAQKEKLSHIAFLQRNLDGKTAEIDKLNFTVFALKAEMRDLQEITRQGNLAATQLEKAKKMMEEKQLKNGNGSQIKGQIVVLEEQLSGFTAEEPSPRDALVKKRLETIKNIELQRVQMRRRNKELELEKRELLVKLYAAHAKISALSDMTQVILCRQVLICINFLASYKFQYLLFANDFQSARLYHDSSRAPGLDLPVFTQILMILYLPFPLL